MKVVLTYGGNIQVFNNVYAVIDNLQGSITIDFWKHNQITINKSKIEDLEILPND